MTKLTTTLQHTHRLHTQVYYSHNWHKFICSFRTPNFFCWDISLGAISPPTFFDDCYFRQ